MRIGFLWQCVYPWDVRMEKVIDACAEAGHTVCLVSRGRPNLPRTAIAGNAQVVRVMAESKGLQGWAGKVFTYPLFFNPAWRRTLLKTFRENKVDLIVVRDLPLGMLGVWAGRKLNKPVVMDMAENYPAALQAYQNALYRPFLFGNAWLPRQYEKSVLRKLSHVFVVAEEQRLRLVTSGVDAAKITLIGNTPVDSLIRSARMNGNDLNGGSSNGIHDASAEINLLYVGKIDAHRGVDLLIQALPGLAAEFPALRLILVGDGKSVHALKQLARDLGVEHQVQFHGWVEWRRISEHIRASAVCLIPHRRSEHTDTTLPNKLFDYMALSKPVIASDCEPLKRIIEGENCGLTFKSGNVSSLRDALRRMLLDPNREEQGRNGRRAIENEYNWTADKAKLLETIARVGEGRTA